MRTSLLCAWLPVLLLGCVDLPTCEDPDPLDDTLHVRLEFADPREGTYHVEIEGWDLLVTADCTFDAEFRFRCQPPTLFAVDDVPEAIAGTWEGGITIILPFEQNQLTEAEVYEVRLSHDGGEAEHFVVEVPTSGTFELCGLSQSEQTHSETLQVD